MAPSFRPVWIIPTAMGDAVRSTDDVESEDEHSILLKSTAAVVPKGSLRLLRSEISLLLYTEPDLPDMLRIRTEISNVCGFVAGYSTLNSRHPAWRSVRSTLGCFREAYSLRGGNLLFLRGKLVFKGATCRHGVYATVRRLICEPERPVLKAYLIIATAYMRRNLFVHTSCLLEEMLSRFSWCRVMCRW